MDEIYKQMQVLKKEKSGLMTQLNDTRKICSHIQSEIDKVRAKESELMDSKSGFQKELDKINLERNKIRK